MNFKTEFKKCQVAIFLFTVTMATFNQGYAQEAAGLRISDPAPSIKYSKWIKGTPVGKYADNQVYVLEFWATWCGPCIAAMPHLSDLATKYKTEATFIGVDVKEETHGKPYETVLPMVERYVNSSADRMKYNVIADNNELHMNKNWLGAAGVRSIPSTFIVQKGKIAWIGHPDDLDNVLDSVIRGTFDMVAYRKSLDQKEKARAEKGEVNYYRLNNRAIKAKLDKKDFSGAFSIIDSLIGIPEFTGYYKSVKFTILLDYVGGKEAVSYSKLLRKEDSSLVKTHALSIISKDGLPKDAYLYAAGILAAQRPEGSMYLNMAGLGYSKAGDFARAVESQQRAVNLVKKQLGDPKYDGIIFDYTVRDYEERLEKYKSELK